MSNAISSKSNFRFLNPEILTRISNMELLARTVVEGFVSGLHKSPYKGFSVEFMGYRQYTPGDEPKHLDWKLYARTDRLFVKEFEDETNTTCHLLLDISPSMGYGSATLSKLEYASYLTATLAYFMIRQQDSVGLCLFDNKVVHLIPSKSTSGHLHLILSTLENAEMGKKSSMGKPFHDMAEKLKKRGIVIIITDLFDEAQSIINGLEHFVFNGNEVILFHILDPNEVQFHFEGVVELEDMETGEKLLVAGKTAQEMYMDKMNQFTETMSKQCGMLGIDYKRLLTNQPLDFALLEYLAARSRYA